MPDNLKGYYLVHNDNLGFLRFNSFGGVRFPVPCLWVDDPRAASKFTDLYEAKDAASRCLRGTNVLMATKPIPEEDSQAPTIFEDG